jgi:hypothetical protein
MRVQIVGRPPYSSYTVTLKKHGGKFVAAGRAGGMCGGLGLQQYSTSGASKGYPCKTCIKGGAYRTVICKCEEWLAPRANSITALWKNLNKAKIPTTTLAMLRSKAQQRKAGLTKLLPQQQMLGGHGGGEGSHGEENFPACFNVFAQVKFAAEIFEKCPGFSATKHPGKGLAESDCENAHFYRMANLVYDMARGCAGDADVNKGQHMNGGALHAAEETTEQGFCEYFYNEADGDAHPCHICRAIVAPCKADEKVGAIIVEAEKAGENPCAKCN